jgi:hypothetical protein
MPGPIMAASPQEQAYRAALARQTASLPPDVRAYIQESYGATQITVLPLPYWSTCRFQGVRAAGPPPTFTIDTTTRRAFSYGVNQSPVSAGFLAAYGNATEAETNLINPSQTRNNADVWIWGLAAYFTQDSEPALARRVMRETDVQISLNGDQSIPLGTLEMFPSAGGLYGAGVSYIKQPDLATPGAANNGAGALLPFFNNGNPAAGNFFRLNQPFKWSGIGTAGADSSLVVLCTPRRQIVESGVAQRAAAAGVSAYDAPAATGDPGTFVDVRFHLICVSVAKRSVNA